MNQVLLGEQIARNRKRLGLTQEGLAARLGVTNQAVSKWENDQSCPDLPLLPLLADLFGITLDALFGRAPAQSVASPVEAPVITADLPWPDDDDLRAVCFRGRRLVEHQKMARRIFDSGKKAELHFTGTVRDIHSDFDVVCTSCTIQGSITAGDCAKCGDGCAVQGDVSAGDGVTCGDVGGNVSAEDSVYCRNVTGSVTAGDSVRCSDVGGSISAGDSITCGSIQGNATAGDSIRCASVGGYKIQG